MSRCKLSSYLFWHPNSSRRERRSHSILLTLLFGAGTHMQGKKNTHTQKKWCYNRRVIHQEAPTQRQRKTLHWLHPVRSSDGTICSTRLQLCHSYNSQSEQVAAAAAQGEDATKEDVCFFFFFFPAVWPYCVKLPLRLNPAHSQRATPSPPPPSPLLHHHLFLYIYIYLRTPLQKKKHI